MGRGGKSGEGCGGVEWKGEGVKGWRSRGGGEKGEGKGKQTNKKRCERARERENKNNVPSFGDSLGSHHSGVRGRLIAVGLNLHATGDTADGLHPGEISHVDKGVVEGRKNVRNAKDVLSLSGVGEVGTVLLDDLGCFSLLLLSLQQNTQTR